MTVKAFDTDRRTNGQLIADCFELGYLRDEDRILDPTYGLGRWWSEVGPPYLTAHDLDPEKAPHGPMDFTALHYEDQTFDAVAYDPPYAFRGTATPSFDSKYGVDAYMSVEARVDLMMRGLSEAIRVCKTGGYVLAKCQDMVVSGEVIWQRLMFAERALEDGCRLVDELYVLSGRPQPAGRRQVHSRRNFSTLQVFRKQAKQ